ncbi:MAG: hypothetical protein JXB29_10775, partial [Sedimentisphaerales bacterium]|nr:hypothetical protein [Sedimentisphaerales bacterium]
MKIANRLSLWFFIVAAVFVGVSLLTFYMSAKTSLEEAINDHLNTTAQSRTYHIETFLRANEEAAKQLSKSIIVEQFLLASKKDEDYDQKLKEALQRLDSM